jgi:uncharacterized RDD family membrane protein YckC
VDSFDTSMFSQSTIPQVQPERIEYASVLRRFGAMLIDNLLLSIINTVIGGVIGFVFGFTNAQSLAAAGYRSGSTLSSLPPEVAGPLMDMYVIVFIISFVLMWLYYAAFESSDLMATPGKRALGMKVTDTEGERISFGTATGRFLGRLISSLILGIGFLIAFFTSKHQALHDLIAGTVVVLR